MVLILLSTVELSLKALLIQSYLDMKKDHLPELTKPGRDTLKSPMEALFFLMKLQNLPLSTQVRLLRVLESGDFMRVGSSKVIKTNVRVVAASNVDLPTAIEQGKFRQDLYYRLNTVPIHVPPLA